MFTNTFDIFNLPVDNTALPIGQVLTFFQESRIIFMTFLGYRFDVGALNRIGYIK